MLRIALIQSLATRIHWSRRSLASAKPSLHAIASEVSGSDIPEKVTVEAPRKRPVLSRATTATEAELEFLEVAASTLIFAHPREGESTWDFDPASAAVLSGWASLDQARQ